jgi:diguanylate cyclase (GGDEF)-like protein
MFSLFVYTFTHSRNSAGAWQFMGVMLSGCVWSLGYAFMLVNTTPSAKIFWFNLSQIGPDFSAVFWYLLALEYTGQKLFVLRASKAALFIIPIMTTILMWTNDLHHLLRTSMILTTNSSNISYFVIQHGPWFWVEIVYGYFLTLSAIVIFARFWIWSSPSGQAGALILGLLIPFVSNILEIIGVNPLTPYGATSIVFLVSGLILGWALFRQHLFDIIPVARDKLFENFIDGVLVVNSAYRIIDANPAAYHLFLPGEEKLNKLLGQNIFTSVFQESERTEYFLDIQTVNKIKKLTNGKVQQFYNVNVSRLFSGKNSPIGWVVVFHDITEQVETNRHLEISLQEIQELQAQMRAEMVRDPLTGCYNRRFLDEFLPQEVALADRNQTTLGLILLDIDRFKGINDHFGHATGDRVLQALGAALLMSVRQSDKVFRYGGEEFLLVLPGISTDAVVDRAQKLCDLLRELNLISASGDKVHLTGSCGVAMYPLHGDTISEILDKADQAMYAAKHAGRNRVCLYGETVN